jgi:hypothetical protein
MAKDPIDFSGQAKHIRDINTALSQMTTHLSSQLRIIAGINTTLAQGSSDLGVASANVDKYLRDAGATSKGQIQSVEAQAVESTGVVSSAGDEALSSTTSTTQGIVDAGKQGAGDFKESWKQAFGALPKVMDEGYNLLMAIGEERADQLTLIQEEYGQNAFSGMTDASTEAGRVSRMALDSFETYYKGVNNELGVTMTQIFSSRKDYEAYLTQISEAPATGMLLMRQMGEEAVNQSILIGRGMGLNAEETREMLDVTMARYGKAGPEMLAKMAVYADQASAATGQSTKKIIAEAHKMATNMDVYGGQTERSMIKTAATAREMGLAIDDVTKIATKFQNFENAATSVGELTQLFGVHLDATELMMAAGEDQGKMLEMVRNSFLGAGKSVQDMTIFEKQAAAAALDIDVETLQQLLNPNIDTEKLEKLKKGIKETSEVKPADALAGLADDIGKVGKNTDELSKRFKDQLAGAMTVALVDKAGIATTKMTQLAEALPVKGAKVLGSTLEKVGQLTGVGSPDQIQNTTKALGLYNVEVGKLDPTRLKEQAGASHELGTSMGAGMAEGFKPAFDIIVEDFGGMLGGIKQKSKESGVEGESISPALGAPILMGYTSTFSEVESSFGGMQAGMVSAGQEAGNALKNDLDSLPKAMTDAQVEALIALNNGTSLMSEEMSQSISDTSSTIQGSQFSLLPPETATMQQAMEENAAVLKALHAGSMEEMGSMGFEPPEMDDPNFDSFISSIGTFEESLSNMSLMSEEKMMNLSTSIAAPLEIPAPSFDEWIDSLSAVELRLLESQGITVDAMRNIHSELSSPIKLGGEEGLDTEGAVGLISSTMSEMRDQDFSIMDDAGIEAYTSPFESMATAAAEASMLAGTHLSGMENMQVDLSNMVDDEGIVDNFDSMNTQLLQGLNDTTAEAELMSATLAEPLTPPEALPANFQMDLGGGDMFKAMSESIKALSTAAPGKQEIGGAVDMNLKLDLGDGVVANLKRKLIFSPGVDGMTISAQPE